MSEEHEQQLLGLLADGNEWAFGSIYNHYARAVYKRADYYIGCPAKADDIKQEVFIKIWANRERFRGMEDFYSYLMITTRNTSLNQLKVSKRLSAIKAISWHVSQLTGNPVEEQLVAKEFTQVYDNALELLPVKRRAVYTLIMEGKKYNEVAKLLKISLYTVKAQRQLASNAVKAYLNDILRLGYNQNPDL